MNCLDFLRELNADPRRLSTAARAHAKDCAACARMQARQTTIENELAAAMNIHPPAGLADRILLDVKLQRRRTFQFLALAASVVLVAGLTLTVPILEQQEGLPAAMIAHVQGEPELLTIKAQAAPEALAHELARIGAVAAAPIPVVHAAPCDVPGGDGGHVVFDTPYGRVTLLLVPNRREDIGNQLKREGFVAVVRAAKRGCYSLIAQNEQALAAAEAMLAERMRWQT